MMKRLRSFGTYVLFIGLGVMLVLSLGSAGRGPSVIRGQRIILEDASGQPKIELSAVGGSGQAIVTIFDNEVGSRLTMMMNSKGLPLIEMHGKGGVLVSQYYLDPNFQPHLDLLTSGGSAELGLSSEGPYLNLWGADPEINLSDRSSSREKRIVLEKANSVID